MTTLTAEDIKFIQTMPSERVTSLEYKITYLFYLIIFNICLTLISIGFENGFIELIHTIIRRG